MVNEDYTIVRGREAEGRKIGRRLHRGILAGRGPAAQRRALADALLGAGVSGPAVVAVIRQTRTGWHLTATDEPRRSRLGGPVEVRAGTKAPRRPSGDPMRLAADIDLAEIGAEPPLPRAGRLQLWEGASNEDFDMNPLAEGRVTYIPPGARTQPVRRSGEGAVRPYASSAMRARQMAMPGAGDVVVDALPDGPERQRLIDLMNGIAEELYDAGPSNLVLGSPSEIQGPVIEEVPYALREYATDPEQAAYTAEQLTGNDWVFLAQVDGDAAIDDMIWGDGGAMYYAIPAEDLAAGRFDRAAAVMQTH